MLSLILILMIVSWINPYIGEFLRESTPVYSFVKANYEEMVQHYLEDAGVADSVNTDLEELPLELQIAVIESIPLPQSVEKALLENNNSKIYKTLGIERFVDYLISYLACCITDGIGFVISFVVASILIKMILYAVDILTDLPVIGFFNTAAGMVLGFAQAIVWIWLFFVVVTMCYNSMIGGVLVDQIRESEVLMFLYDRNLLMDVIMSAILR